MILIAKQSDSGLIKGEKYYAFGLLIYLETKEIWVSIRRSFDSTPVLENLNKFDIENIGDLSKWEKKIFKDSLAISIKPYELIDFDWDSYHNGNEELEQKFENFYKEFIGFHRYTK